MMPLQTTHLWFMYLCGEMRLYIRVEYHLSSISVRGGRAAQMFILSYWFIDTHCVKELRNVRRGDPGGVSGVSRLNNVESICGLRSWL